MLRPDRRRAADARVTTRRCSSSPASRSACSARMPMRPRVLHRQLEPRGALGGLGALQRARPQGPDDVRPDDGRQLDLHRQPGHRAGHLRDLRRNGPPAFRRQPRRQVDSHRRPRRHGRRAAAGRHHGRRLDAGDRVPPGAHRQAPADALPRCAVRTLDEALESAGARAPAKAGVRGPARQCVRGAAGTAAPRRAPGRRDGPDLRARPGEWLPARRAGRSSSGTACAPRTRRRWRARRAQSMARHVEAMLEFQALGIPVVRLRQQHPPGRLR